MSRKNGKKKVTEQRPEYGGLRRAYMPAFQPSDHAEQVREYNSSYGTAEGPGVRLTFCPGDADGFREARVRITTTLEDRGPSIRVQDLLDALVAWDAVETRVEIRAVAS